MIPGEVWEKNIHICLPSQLLTLDQGWASLLGGALMPGNEVGTLDICGVQGLDMLGIFLEARKGQYLRR